MRLDLTGYRRLALLVVVMAFIVCEVGCAKKRDPLGKDGLQIYVYEAVDVGFEFEYELTSYSSKIQKVENGGWGRISERLIESYTMRVAEKDHKRILDAVRKLPHWRKYRGFRDPNTKEYNAYIYRCSKSYVEQSMASSVKVFDNSDEIEIIFFDVNPVHLIH